MRLLGLDLGNNTGWALSDQGVIKHGVWELAPTAQHRFEGGGLRFVRLEDYLDSFLTKGVDRLALEEVRAHSDETGRTNITAAQVYGGFLATVTGWAERHKIPYVGFGAGVIKKRATDKGNANKELVMAAASKALNQTITDDNEADAFWVLVLLAESARLRLHSHDGQAIFLGEDEEKKILCGTPGSSAPGCVSGLNPSRRMQDGFHPQERKQDRKRGQGTAPHPGKRRGRRRGR